MELSRGFGIPTFVVYKLYLRYNLRIQKLLTNLMSWRFFLVDISCQLFDVLSCHLT